METYKISLINEIKSLSVSDAITDREAFFQIYCEKLNTSEIIEDSQYLYFSGLGSYSKKIQIDGYSYNELDEKLILFIIPNLSYYEDKTLNKKDMDAYFKRAQNFFFDASKIVSDAEDSSEGYGLAYDIINRKMTVRIIEIIILTDLNLSNKVEFIESTIKNDIRVEFTIYDLKRMKLIDDSVNGNEKLEINLADDFDFEGIPAILASSTDSYEAYLCNIPGELLAKMYDKYQSRLLEGNVRSFLQAKGKVNKGIRLTILQKPEMFFAYNNGIAATVEDMIIEQTDKGIVIKGFTALQIVNGGQTTASLAGAWTNDTRHNSREQISKIHVPMKISKVSYENAQELIPNISKFANSQNKVSDSDLASNHPFHIKMEELSRRMSAPAIDGAQFGTYWYYERANGQYRQATYKASKSVKKNYESRNPKKQMFKKVDLAKSYNIYLKKPNIASAGAQKSFNNFSKWMISKWDKNPNMVNDNFYKKSISLMILYKETDKIIRMQDWYDSYKANIIAYTLSSIFDKVSTDFPESNIDYTMIWKRQSLSLGWQKQIKIVSKKMYYHLIDPNRTVENVTEWAKRQVCWDQARELKYEYDEQFIIELIDKKYVKTHEESAIKEEKKNKDMDATIKIFEYGASYWKDLKVWGTHEKIWNEMDIKLLNLANKIESGLYPTDKQSIEILKILDKARLEGFVK